MRVAIGAPVAQRAWILQDWFDCIRSQTVEADIDVFCYYTASNDGTLDLLAKNDAYLVTGVEKRTRNLERVAKHAWSPKTGEYTYMAYMRNRLVDAIRESGADYFFSLDTDILMHPRTVEYLLHTFSEVGGDAVSPLVDMQPVRENGYAWNFMEWRPVNEDENPWGFDARRDKYVGLPPFKLPQHPFKTDVIMAAIFMGRKAMENHWAHSGQGEDVGWSHNAKQAGLNLWVDPGVICNHRMHEHEPAD